MCKSPSSKCSIGVTPITCCSIGIGPDLFLISPFTLNVLFFGIINVAFIIYRNELIKQYLLLFLYGIHWNQGVRVICSKTLGNFEFEWCVSSTVASRFVCCCCSKTLGNFEFEWCVSSIVVSWFVCCCDHNPIETCHTV